MTPAFQGVTNVLKINRSCLLQTHGRTHGWIKYGIGLAYGRPNISLLFETHPSLLLETLERERSGNKSGAGRKPGEWERSDERM